MKRENREEEKTTYYYIHRGKVKMCLKLFLWAGLVVHQASHVPGADEKHKQSLQLSITSFSCLARYVANVTRC